MGKTVQEFVAERYLGKIHHELPGQFYDSTISELVELNNNGNSDAKKCFKFLNQNRFRKW